MILALLRDPEKGLEKKRRYDQDIGLYETFLEAVPTTIILTLIWVSTKGWSYLLY